MHRFWTAAILTALAVCPGCAPLVLIAYGIEIAAAPGPFTTIEVISESDPGTCATLIGGDRRDAYLRGQLTRYYGAASIKSPADTRVSDWKREPVDGSFMVLAGTREPRPQQGGPRGRSFDAARSYFDFNGDGTNDLVYEIAGPPRLMPAFVVMPADDQLRLWFESRLGRSSQNWRTEIAARGGRVVELSQRDDDRLSAADRPIYVALPDFTVLRHGGHSYVLVWERDVPFDAMRLTPPLSLGDAEADESAATAATVASIYSVEPDFELTKRCEVLGQWIGVVFPGF